MNRTLVYSLAWVTAISVTGFASRGAMSTAQNSALVRLQASSPGIVQTGHINVSGDVRGGIFFGSGSGLVAVPLTALQQGGAVTNKVLKWNGSSWAPADDLQGSLSSVTHDSTMIGAGTSGSPLGVAVPLVLTGAIGSPNGIIEGRNSAGGFGVRGTHVTTGSYGGLGTLDAGVYGTGPNYGVWGDVGALDTIGVRGTSTASTGTGKGVYGRSDASFGYGVYGLATSGTGANAGVYGFSSSSAGYGVHGLLGAVPATFLPNSGVGGESVTKVGVAGVSNLQDGVYGKTQKIGTFALGSGSLIGGVHGYAADADGTLDNFGVIGSGSGYATGVLGVGSGRGHGVIGIPGSQNETHTAVGVLGLTNEGGWPPGPGLNMTTDKSQVAILGQSNARVAVWGESLAKIGVIGTVGDTFTAGLLGSDLAGVMGRASLATSNAVVGIATGSANGGVQGKFGPNTGTLGTTTAGVMGVGTIGVQAFTPQGPAALTANHAFGFWATLASTSAAFSGGSPGGLTSATLAGGNALEGYAVGSHIGLSVQHANGTGASLCGPDWGLDLVTSSASGIAITANGAGATAGYFAATGGGATNGIIAIASTAGSFGGDVGIAGTMTASAKFFRIDHPSDPANKYLNHACVESNQMRNMYAGRVTLDAKGESWVELPSYFETINGDPEYHLTPIGGAAPDLHIAEEVSGNRFKIGGGKPGLKVSWQVYGIRTDPYAEAHPIVVEQNKPERFKGRYLHPELYGQPASMGIIRPRDIKMPAKH